jgi:hypothetical protein
MASRRVLTDALRIRLLMDNPTRLRLTSWISDEWTNHDLSFYYGSEETLDNRIFETIRDVLATENKTISTAVANTLRNSVKLSNKPLEAVAAMVTANESAQDN